MSNNTQKQGRTLQSEAGYTFTPRTGVIAWGPPVGDDAVRSLARWEIELQRQLTVGDVTKDASAKLNAMKYNGVVAMATPAVVSNVNLTKNTAIATGGRVLTTITKGVPSSVSAASGVVPTGCTLSVDGQTVKLNGTPTGTGGFTFTDNVVTDNGTVTVSVSGTVAV